MTGSSFQAVVLWLAEALERSFSSREIAVWISSASPQGFAYPSAREFEDSGPLPSALSEVEGAVRQARFFIGLDVEMEYSSQEEAWSGFRAAEFPAIFLVPFEFSELYSRRRRVSNGSTGACVRVPDGELRVTLRRDGTVSIERFSWRGTQFSMTLIESLRTEAEKLVCRPVDCKNVPESFEVERPRFELEAKERERFIGSVRDIQSHMREGDCYLMNFATRVTVPVSRESFSPTAFLNAWFRRPTRYGAWFALDDLSVISFSPERFLRASGGEIVAEPIKGTLALANPRSASFSDAENLWSQTKEICEHTMVVDLLRNDLNGVCNPGTVKVHRPFFAAIAGPILQMQTSVTGALHPAMDWSSVIRSLVPGGSVSGTPKRRVCERIAQFEPQPREFYTGVLGVADGPMDFDAHLLIRSLFRSQGTAWAGVGAGITTLSDPEAEARELEVKLSSFLEPFIEEAP